MNDSFATLVARLRNEQCLTQLELAERIGVAEETVSMWERGLSLPSASSASRLAAVLGVASDELPRAKGSSGEKPAKERTILLINRVLVALAVIIGVVVSLFPVSGAADNGMTISLLGSGLTLLGLSQISRIRS